MSLSLKAEEVFQDTMRPLMTAIQHDALENQGKIYDEIELLNLAVSMQLYALSKGKKIRIDLETKLVILE